MNENDEIIGYASVGGCGGIEIDDNALPEGFENNFVPSFYLYQNNKVMQNPNYSETGQSGNQVEPTSVQVALTALAQNCSTSLQHIKAIEQSLTALSKDLGDGK